VVYVHGIGRHDGAAAWKDMWDIALFGRSMGSETIPAYWADILHGDARAKTPAKASRRGRNADPRAEFERSLRSQFVGDDAPEGRRFGTRVLPLPEFLRTPLTKAFLAQFVKDTAAYLYDEPLRQQMRRRLLDVIRPLGNEPFVIVAHSQGTMIAYDVLHEVATTCAVSRFVTLGSPLGIQEVQDRLRKLLRLDDTVDLPIPACIQRWDNFAARFDPVAADPLLADDFTNGTAKLRDHRIDNPSAWQIKDFNPHDSRGYLANPDVRGVVYRAVGYDLTSRFVVARDVMEQCACFPSADGRKSQRLPVLIEVLEPARAAVGETDAAMKSREKKAGARGQTLDDRIHDLHTRLRGLVRGDLPAGAARQAEAAARIQSLRKYVAAHLTPTEVETVAAQPGDFHVYAVWRSSGKRKLLTRSHAPLSVDAARASYKADGRGITWAVLDTGCRPDHAHFAAHGTVVQVFDCTTPDAEPPELDGAAADPDGHGTHVCGIIAGQGQTNEETPREVLGLAPRARLVVYKVLDEQGRGEDAWIIKAIDHVFRTNQAHPGIKIHGVNLSLGGPFDPSVYGCGYSPICKELRDLWRQGVVVCVAAGNEGMVTVTSGGEQRDLYAPLSIGDPANLDDCIAVGSVNADKPHLHGISHFSSRGPTADGRVKPDVVAPGERILSCNSDFGGGRRRANGTQRLYREDSGTSMACPHVSGLIAAFLSVRREFIGRPDEVKRILLENCNDLGRDRYHQGAGMPNLMKMLMNT
jgi:subtilisin family serine protease